MEMSQHPQNEASREQPISPYSLAKVAGSHFLQMLYRTENFPAVILRLFLTYGPGQNSFRFLPQIIHGCLKDDSFPASKGEQFRDFCYIDDTIGAIILALTLSGVDGEIINVATGEPITIRGMIEKVCRITGSWRTPVWSSPLSPRGKHGFICECKKSRTILTVEIYNRLRKWNTKNN